MADGSTKVYYYYRRNGVRLRGEPGSQEFQRSYDEARNARKIPDETFQRLIVDFFSSQKFNKLAPRTQSDYIKLRKWIEEKWATLPIAALEEKACIKGFRKWRDTLVQEVGARQADAIFGLARRIVSFAHGDGELSQNLLLGIESVYKADRSDIIWLPEDVEIFLNSANTGMQMALILALNLGRREADLIRLTWADDRGDTMMVTNRKSGRAVKFPAKITTGLRAALDAYKASLGFTPHPTRTILTQPRANTPWSDKQFSNKFSKAKNAAGLTHLHFHDLRGTAVTVLAEEGCTDTQIAAITGHSLKQVSSILDKYLARTRTLNVAATKRLEESWIAKLAIRGV